MSTTPEDLERVTSLVLQFLESKAFFGAERALRTELALALEACERDPSALQKHSLFASELEQLLGIDGPTNVEAASPIRDFTPPLHQMNQTAAERADAEGASEANNGPEALSRSAAAAAAGGTSDGSTRQRARLYELSLFSASNDERVLRKHYGRGNPQSRVVFHDPPAMSDAEAANLAHVSLPILYNPHVNGLEDARELPVAVGTLLIGRYRVVAVIGKGSFSRVFQCLDLRQKCMVSIKVLRNDKDCLDAGLGEVKVLALLARHDPFGDQQLVRLRDYFYYKVCEWRAHAHSIYSHPPLMAAHRNSLTRAPSLLPSKQTQEHLLIVTELLRDSLFQFYRYIDASDERGVGCYFTPPTIANIAGQLLHGLDFLHSIGRTLSIAPNDQKDSPLLLSLSLSHPTLIPSLVCDSFDRSDPT